MRAAVNKGQRSARTRPSFQVEPLALSVVGLNPSEVVNVTDVVRFKRFEDF